MTLKRFKTIQLFLALSSVLLFGHFAQAGCNPCVCGPDGSFQGDLNEWWRINCPSHFSENPGTKKDVRRACIVRDSKGLPTDVKHDPLFFVLQKAANCPVNVQGLKSLLTQAGLATQPYMVANRGIHNPALGSFSFFEQVSGISPLLTDPIGRGEFFFGHFTTADNNLAIADQEPSKGKLLIELIAWDKLKNLFNFYELIGTGNGAQWFYRGDSGDILADNAHLYLNSQGPKFGSTLRCSGCHTSGGPIMKEMAAPHNDWWTTSRPLSFSPNAVSSELANWVQQLGDASDFSQSVKVGISKLEGSPQYQNAKQRISLQATLRPLFCETEINLESDAVPLDKGAHVLQIPSASVVNPYLAKGSLTINSSSYRQLLNDFGMRFPETNLPDADHGWLVAVKGHSDLVAIQSLLEKGIVTEEFIADVLAVDFEHPLFSAKRCGLVQLIPQEGLKKFADRLKSSTLPGASELFDNLTNPRRNRSFHFQRAQALLTKTQLALNTVSGQKEIFRKLVEGREAVFSAEISKNPRGQILEPGFRVIFPVPR